MPLWVLWAWLAWQAVVAVFVGIFAAYENKLNRKQKDAVLTALCGVFFVPLSFGVVVACVAEQVTEWYLRPQTVARGLRRAKK